MSDGIIVFVLLIIIILLIFVIGCSSTEYFSSDIENFDTNKKPKKKNNRPKKKYVVTKNKKINVATNQFDDFPMQVTMDADGNIMANSIDLNSLSISDKITMDSTGRIVADDVITNALNTQNLSLDRLRLGDNKIVMDSTGKIISDDITTNKLATGELSLDNLRLGEDKIIMDSQGNLKSIHFISDKINAKNIDTDSIRADNLILDSLTLGEEAIRMDSLGNFASINAIAGSLQAGNIFGQQINSENVTSANILGQQISSDNITAGNMSVGGGNVVLNSDGIVSKNLTIDKSGSMKVGETLDVPNTGDFIMKVNTGRKSNGANYFINKSGEFGYDDGYNGVLFRIDKYGNLIRNNPIEWKTIPNAQLTSSSIGFEQTTNSVASCQNLCRDNPYCTHVGAVGDEPNIKCRLYGPEFKLNSTLGIKQNSKVYAKYKDSSLDIKSEGRYDLPDKRGLRIGLKECEDACTEDTKCYFYEYNRDGGCTLQAPSSGTGRVYQKT